MTRNKVSSSSTNFNEMNFPEKKGTIQLESSIRHRKPTSMWQGMKSTIGKTGYIEANKTADRVLSKLKY